MSELLDLVLRAHGGVDRWRTVISPFGKPDQRMVFTPERVVVETTSGSIVEERSNPRAAFAGHTLTTPWDLLHRAYFNGLESGTPLTEPYARWTYLNTPFLLAMPGFEVTEIAPWHEADEVWRGLRARFPDRIASQTAGGGETATGRVGETAGGGE